MIYLFNNKKELNKILPQNNIISAIQELEINGLYLAEIEVPLFYTTEKGQSYNHKKSFDTASFFGFFDTKKKFQLYKIHTRKVDGRNLVVSGVHIFFDEAKAMNVIRDKRLVDVDAQSATNTAFSGTGWTVKSSDITSLKSLDFYYETPQDARKRIIELWNIEFDYDLGFDGRKITSKNMYIRKKLGQWTGDRYAYGTNILNIVQEQDEAEVFTAAIGRGTADDTNTALNSKVLFDDLAWSKDGYTKPVGQDYIEIVSATEQYGYYDAAGNVKPRIAIVDFDDIQDQKVLADKTYEWLKQNCVPKVSYETTVAKSGDYYLGDEIGIIYKEIDVVKKARVEKIRVNLLNPKLSELGLGDYSFFKQDRFKKNVKKDIATVKKDTLTGIQKLRQDFSEQFDATKQAWDAQIKQVEINANAEVTAAETRMQGVIDNEISAITSPDSFPADALKLDALFVDKLLTTTVFTQKLVAQEAFITSVKTMSLEAVYADIANLRAKVITADSITSTAIKSDIAMIDKLFASSALIERLTSKSAFIDSINAISVTANSVLINSVKGELGKPNSGFNIRRPDGALWIENGQGKNEMIVTGCLPRFASTSTAGFGMGVWENGEWLVTARSKAGTDYVRIDALYFNHDYRYLTVSYAVKSEKTGVFVRVEEFGAPTEVTPFSAYKGYTASIGSGTTYDSFVIDLGVPTYKRRQFYLMMKPNTEGTVDDLAFARFLPMRLNG